MNIPGKIRISIRFGLLAGVVSLVAVTAALVHVPWSLTARAGVTDLALRLNEQSIENARARMSALLEDAVATQTAIAANLRAGSIDIGKTETREPFLLSFIENYPAISSIEIGWPDDRSFAVRRIGNSQAISEETNPKHAPGSENGYTHGGTVMSRAEYAVSHQFWFKQAFAISGSSWSDIYRRADNGQLAFTRVEAVTLPNGHPIVVAVTMELNRISAFLDTIKATSGGTVFLTNTYGELVAPAAASTGLQSPAGLKLSEAELPHVVIAAEAFDAHGIALSNLKEPHQIVYRPGGEDRDYFVTVSPLTQMGLIVGLVVPQSAILGGIEKNTANLAYLLLIFTGVTAMIVASLATWTLGRPLTAVTRNARLLGDFRFDEIKQVNSFLLEIGALSQATGQMSASLASFRKYVPTDVVRMLFAQGMEAEPGGTRRDLSILFMDMANFTQIAEALGEDLIPFLGEFLSEMSDEIRGGGGTVDKYIGDAIMAFWGAPVRNGEHAIFACRAALACQERLRALRGRAAIQSGVELRARIGINTGRVLVGNVGSRDRLNYTAIGDPVNVASRLEPLNKRYGSEILIGEQTYLEAKEHIVARRLDSVAVYGKAEGIRVYELLALSDGAAPELLNWVAAYERGVEAFLRREWDAAETLFLQVIAMRGGDDVPSTIMLESIRQFRLAPPRQDWNGILRLTEK
jgi:adenylate cyclase